MSQEKENISEFEYDPQYWKEAEMLIHREEKRRRVVFWFRASGLAATLLFLLGSAVYFAVDKKVESAETLSLQLQKDAEIVKKDEVLQYIPLKKNTAITSADGNEKPKKEITAATISGRFYKGKMIPDGFDRIEKSQSEEHVFMKKEEVLVLLAPQSKSQEASLSINGNASESLSDKAHFTSDFSCVGKTIINGVNGAADFALLFEVPSAKKSAADIEVYASAMMHPNYGYGNADKIWLLSGNAGFSVSRKLAPRISMSFGAQYNYYRGLYDQDQHTDFKTKNVDTVVQYYKIVQNQNLVPGGLVNGDVIFVNNSVISSIDTLSFGPANDQNTIQGRHTRTEKNVLSGAILIPIEIRYQYKRMRWISGFSLEYLLYNQVEVYESTNVSGWILDQKSTVQKNDFNGLNRLWYNAVLGMDYRINPYFSIGARAVLGMNDITKNAYFANTANDKNINFSLSLRYHLNSLFF